MMNEGRTGDTGRPFPYLRAGGGVPPASRTRPARSLGPNSATG